jgi:hypothetical protein
MTTESTSHQNSSALSVDHYIAPGMAPFWLALMIVSAVFICIAGVAYRSGAVKSDAVAKLEVTAADYTHLASTAALSCSGTDILKQVVLKGPISNADLPNIRADLQKRAEVQAALRARGEIAGSGTSCA